jgi:hypothetical protein
MMTVRESLKPQILTCESHVKNLLIAAIDACPSHACLNVPSLPLRPGSGALL